MKPEGIENIYRLSPLQEGLLFHSLYAPGSGLYVEQAVCTLAGPLDVAALQRAWHQVLERHPALRSSFHWQELDRPLQVVYRQVEPAWELQDWRQRSRAGLEARFAALLAADRRRGFDLEDPPLVRFTLVRVGEERHRFLWSYHHLLVDGWSVALVLGEVFELYRAARRGEEPRLPRPRPYADYITWLAERDRSEDEAFWRRELAGLAGPGRLWDGGAGPGSDRGGPADFADREVELSRQTTQALADLARSSGLTLNTLVQGAWGLLLARQGGTSDALFGAVASGRPPGLPGTETMVGMFINTLPVRVQVRGQALLIPWLQELQKRQTELRRHEHTPLNDVQRWSGVAAGEPLFESLVAFENYPRKPGLFEQAADLAVEDLESIERTNYPLNLSVVPGEELWLRVTHDRRRVDDREAERLLARLTTLLAEMAREPDRPLAALPSLPEGERRELLAAATGPTPGPEPPPTLIRRFARQAERTPDAVAWVTPPRGGAGPGLVTYSELARRTGRLARRLAESGVGPEVLVGLHLERSAQALVALLAVMEAGGAYLPLDPDYPPERLAFMLADARVPVLVTTSSLARRLADTPVEPAPRPVLVDEEEEPAPAPPLAAAAAPDELAYVIYTSGSTGRPKGVMVTHGGVAHALAAALGWFQRRPPGRLLQAAALSFDASVLELFLALGSGGTLCPVEVETLLSGPELLEHLRRHAVTTAVTVPSLLEALPSAELPALATVLVGAERCRGETAERWGEGRRLLNLYAPTEVSIFATAWDSFQGEAGDLAAGPPIGRPIAGATAHLLDPWGHLAPAGAPGELALGGTGVARGYLGRPALTAERFVPDPFAEAPGGRLYSSGDLARLRPDGELAFLGRSDRQVKIRGFRVEPGEVEAALAAHPAVAECAVAAWEDGGGGGARLAAYAVAAAGTPLPAPAELRRYLARRLPGYMVPALFVPLEELPRTATGKLDRRALPAPDLEEGPGRAEYRPPRNPTEEALAAIWAQVLGVERVGIDDDFFDLGGDSILSLQILSRAAEAGLRLGPKEIFDHPTVAALAAVAEAGGAREAEEEESGPAPLTPIQAHFFHQGFARPQHWNMALLLTLREELEPALLARVLAGIVTHHDALRLRFEETPEGWRQRPAPAGEAEAPLAEVDLSSLPEAEQPRALEEAAAALQQGFDLGAGPLFAAALFHLGAGRPGRLLLAAHHLAVDAVSWRVLLEELEAGYRQLEAGAPLALPPRSTPFTVWARRLAEQAASPQAAAELPFWRSLAQPPPDPLPRDFAGGANREATGVSHQVALDPERTEALLARAHEAYQTRSDELLLAALALALARWSGGERFLLHLEGHGRESLGFEADLSRSVGWFTNLYPAVLAPPPTGGPGEVVKAIKEQLRRIPRRGMGWGLLRHLHPEAGAGLAELPRPEVSFNYLGRLEATFAGSTLLAPARESTGPAHSPEAQRSHLLEINALVLDGRLTADFRYSTDVHRQETVAELAATFQEALAELVDHCLDPEAGAYTPSDFPAAELDQASLDKLLGRLGGAKKGA